MDHWERSREITRRQLQDAFSMAGLSRETKQLKALLDWEILGRPIPEELKGRQKHDESGFPI